MKAKQLKKNQTVITADDGTQYFQSYNSIIVKRSSDGTVYLDAIYWDCSRTTGKYRNEFLGETKKETELKIKSGLYILTNLNPK